MNIDHIAHAVPNIDKAILAYKKLFNVPISEIMIIEKQNIKMAVISFENLKIELMEPLNDKSPITKFGARPAPRAFRREDRRAAARAGWRGRR